MPRNNFSLGYMNFKQFTTADITGARMDASRLDGVTTVPLWREAPGAKGVQNPITGEIYDGYVSLPRHVGVMNTRSHEVTMTASPRYEVIQHSEVINHVIDAIEPLKEQTAIKVENHGDAVEFFVLFPGMKVNDKAEGILPGLMFKHSYKAKDSFKGTFFGWRLACSNGMMHANAFGEHSLSIWHNRDKVARISESIRDFIEHMLQNVSKLEPIIEAAQNSEVKFRNYQQVVDTLIPIVGGERRAEKIAPSIQGAVTRWDIYNAITAEASHGDHITPGTRNRLIGSAEKNVLMVDELALPVMVPVAA